MYESRLFGNPAEFPGLFHKVVVEVDGRSHAYEYARSMHQCQASVRGTFLDVLPTMAAWRDTDNDGPHDDRNSSILVGILGEVHSLIIDVAEAA